MLQWQLLALTSSSIVFCNMGRGHIKNLGGEAGEIKHPPQHFQITHPFFIRDFYMEMV